MNKNENTIPEAEAVVEVMPKTPAELEAYLNEYISVKLFRDNDKYKEPVYVAVNGQNCVIKRGEWVKVRRKFALVLDQSEVQDLRTTAMMEQQADQFKTESAAYGVS